MCTRPPTTYRDGFKTHIAIEPDTGLITSCDLTPGNVGDAQAAMGLFDREPAVDLPRFDGQACSVDHAA
jgi:hypothetical protein